MRCVRALSRGALALAVAPLVWPPARPIGPRPPPQRRITPLLTRNAGQPAARGSAGRAVGRQGFTPLSKGVCPRSLPASARTLGLPTAASPTFLPPPSDPLLLLHRLDPLLPNIRFFETFSYLPPLTDDQIARQVDYIVNNGWTPCLEFADAATAYTSNANVVRVQNGTSPVSANNNNLLPLHAPGPACCATAAAAAGAAARRQPSAVAHRPAADFARPAAGGCYARRPFAAAWASKRLHPPLPSPILLCF